MAAGPPHATEAVIERGGAELRFAPGGPVRDLRGGEWRVSGDLSVLEAGVDDGVLTSDGYPDPLARVWSALNAPHAADIVISAAPGYELVDWGGVTHCPGGSHGALEAGDSLGPLLLYGLDPAIVPAREQWAIRDVAGLVLGHFGLGGAEGRTAAPMSAASREAA